MKTPTTKLNVRVHTSNMLIYGIMHLLPQGDISGLLNNNRLFFPLTEAKVFKRGLKHPPSLEDLHFEPEFLAVPKEKVLWLNVGDSSRVFAPGVQLRSIHLLFSGYVLRGNFLILPSVRTSDFLVRAVVEKPFQYLFNAELLLPPQGKSKEARVIERFPVITVNLGSVAGVFDSKDDVMDLPEF